MKYNSTKVVLLIFICSIVSHAQFDQYHPELEWKTIKGKYIDVHFHDGTERTAKVVALIADEIWEPVTSLYEYEPERVHYVIKDIDDYSNGATYFFDNKIEIWTSALDFDLRGTHNWLRNVISHEFTHMVQIQASLKTGRRIPALYLQWLNYEDERRPDILYGFPNAIVSYPVASLNMPAWFAEGTAQYMRKEFDYDNWDSHRDMILRSYILDGNLLSWNQMGVFDKTSLGNESVYNLGFALTTYIAQKYGEDKLRLITKALGKISNFTIDAAIYDVLGITGKQLYQEWKEFLEIDYKNRIEKVIQNKIEGEKILAEGFGNFYPQLSKDEKAIFYISNKKSDYFSPSGLYRYNLETKEDKLIKVGIRSTFSLFDDDRKVIYSKLSDDNPNWYNVHDIYVYDIEKEKETRLTHNLRADQPSLSNDGEKIVFLFQKDGTTNLGLVDKDGKNFQRLTAFVNGEQVYNPKFTPDDAKIVFDFSYHHNRDIAIINVDGSDFKFLLQTSDDERNPIIDSNNFLTYSSDKTGIYNIYKRDLATGDETQLTNVTGGAFMPHKFNNNLVYAGYTSTGYKIYRLTDYSQNKIAENDSYLRKLNPPLGEFTSLNNDFHNFDSERLRIFNDYNLPDVKTEKYSGAFTKLSFFPFIRFDNYNTSNKFTEKIKPGVYVASSDMLNKYSLFAGGSLNTRFERDLFLMFEYKNKLPLFYQIGLKPELALELYNISRKANVDITFDEYPSLKTDVTYSLFEVNLAAKHRLFAKGSNLELRYIFSKYTATLGSFIIPGTNGALYPTSDDTYLLGSNIQATYTFQSSTPYIDADINPIPLQLELKYNYEMNKFNPDGEYEVVNGMLEPLYKDFNFHKVELNIQQAFRFFGNHSITNRLRVGNIFGETVPDFFDFYLGGLIGLKAYPFYALSGNKLFWYNLTYRFPLFKNIDTKIGHLYLDKVFFSVFGDIGNAWNGNSIPSINQFKKGAGAELRIGLNSFYLFPTSVFFNASYGFDEIERFTREKQKVVYGKEWRFYGGVLFGFDF
ncbi:MAG: biopolymer transporter Tol [Ignavibacteriaceae bacterium]|nr:biopolymer transporter Tol [Ignavibacteriaceae bacterium]